MTSLPIDYGGIESMVFAPAKMESMDDEISDAKWKEIARHMQISQPEILKQYLGQSCSNKFLKKFFPSSDATRNLRTAAKLGKIDMVKALLELGRVDVNLVDKTGQTALHYAAREGHLEIVSMLLEKQNINTSICDHSGNTTLHIAAKYGRILVFDMLLKVLEMDVISTNDSGETVLVLAAGRGHREIVDKLLEETKVFHISEGYKSDALHEAARNGHVIIVEKLLNEMNVNSTTSSKNKSSLHLAVEGEHETTVDLLLKKGNVDPSIRDIGGNIPLHIAAEKGNEVILEKLLQMREVDATSANKKGMTALHVAAEYKQANIVTMLLGMPNVDPCLGDNHGDTPLHLAAKWGHKDIAERLLVVPHLDIINKVNEQNETPLFVAARHGSLDVVNNLLENPKVDLSICDKQGDSPFHVAMKGGHTKIARKLITHPSAVSIHANKENVTRLHLCIWRGHENLVDMLLEQSPQDANAKDASGNFPIHYAAQKGNICIFEMLLNSHVKVDVNSINDHLETALHIAIKAGHVHIVDLLIQEPTLDASMRDRNGNLPLHVAAKYDGEEMIEKLLTIPGVEVNSENEDGVTALVLAAEEGHRLFVEKLLEKKDYVLNSAKEGERKPSKTDWGVHSLLRAARNGHPNIIKILLAKGVNVNGTHPSLHSALQGAIQGLRHKSALSEAIKHGRIKVVNILLKDPNIDPNRRNEDGEHLFYIAAKYGQRKILKELMDIRPPIDVNVLSNGQTALHGAAENGRESVVEFLLNIARIDVRIRTAHYGESALFYAARKNNKSILGYIYEASKRRIGSNERIVEKPLSLNDMNDEGDSIIHLAARDDLLNVIDFLVEAELRDKRSVDVNLKTLPPKGKREDGLSALQIAIRAGNYTIVEKLMKFENISLIQEKDGQIFLQDIFKNKDSRWETYSTIMRTPQVTDYIDALYKDRQASVDAANAILVGAALIASVTFASWLQPPLGYATYYHEQFSESLLAPSIAYPEYAAFDHHPSLQAFWVFNSLSFFCAIATVISGAQSVLPSKALFIKQEVENLHKNLLMTSILLCFSMFFVLLAFATAGVLVLPPLLKFRANIFSTIGIGGSLCFMLLFFFGKNIYKLHYIIKSSQTSESKVFFEQ